MTKRTTVRLPEELLKRAKRKAAEGRTLTSLITDGLQHVVSEPRSASRHSRVLPRVSKAKGGVMPGVDFDSLSNLQEKNDLDRVDFMNQIK